MNKNSGEDWANFVYRPRIDQPFENDRCFLCGVALVRGVNRTDEHVFPQWLLREYDLWNEQITLLNGTTMHYSALKIPCCSTCNNEYLSSIERRVGDAFKEGPSAVASLDPKTLFLWLGKVYYGLMFRELFLAQDRRHPMGEPIVDEEMLSRFHMHHMLMQAARGVVQWTPQEGPASVFVFRCQEPTNRRHRFDYWDSFHAPYLAIRIGQTAVIAVLQDWGALKGAVTVPAFEAAAQLELHPQQFREIAALGLYMMGLFNRVPKHLLVGGDDHVQVVTLPIGGLSAKPVFDPFDISTYAMVLANVLGQPVENLFDGSRIVTLICESDGKPWTVPWSADEWVPLQVNRAGGGAR